MSMGRVWRCSLGAGEAAVTRTASLQAAGTAVHTSWSVSNPEENMPPRLPNMVCS